MIKLSINSTKKIMYTNKIKMTMIKIMTKRRKNKKKPKNQSNLLSKMEMDYRILGERNQLLWSPLSIENTTKELKNSLLGSQRQLFLLTLIPLVWIIIVKIVILENQERKKITNLLSNKKSKEMKQKSVKSCLI